MTLCSKYTALQYCSLFANTLQKSQKQPIFNLLKVYNCASTSRLYTGYSPGGNTAHLAPEILNAKPGPKRYIDYSKQPVWAAGVLLYELAGELRSIAEKSEGGGGGNCTKVEKTCNARDKSC